VGVAIEIAPGKGEAGEIIIRYRSLEQFETVRKKLMGFRRPVARACPYRGFSGGESPRSMASIAAVNVP